jgi:hypothetical protein
MRNRLVLLLVIILPFAAAAYEYDVYVGGPDSGLDLVYRDGEFGGGWPGGVLWSQDYVPFEGCCNEINLITLPNADEEVVKAARSRLVEFGDVFPETAEMNLQVVHDPGAVTWVVEAEPDVEPDQVLLMAQYLRAKAPFIRENWLNFVCDKGLALTGWGALFVKIEDGTLTSAEYQPYDYSAQDQLREWGFMGEDEEYADHPEANGIAEWLTPEGLSPLVEGTFTLGYAVKFD